MVVFGLVLTGIPTPMDTEARRRDAARAANLSPPVRSPTLFAATLPSPLRAPSDAAAAAGDATPDVWLAVPPAHHGAC
eukprot:5601917-Prymnesium_polylepis.1